MPFFPSFHIKGKDTFSSTSKPSCQSRRDTRHSSTPRYSCFVTFYVLSHSAAFPRVVTINSPTHLSCTEMGWKQSLLISPGLTASVLLLHNLLLFLQIPAVKFSAREQNHKGTCKHPSPFWQRRPRLSVQTTSACLPSQEIWQGTGLRSGSLSPRDKGSAGALFPFCQSLVYILIHLHSLKRFISHLNHAALQL